MTPNQTFTFADLFAGIGGFHAALHAAGGQWVFASEIDGDASRVYDHNWLRPQRERAKTTKEAARYQMSGDIVPLTDPEVLVPHADVLAAGFPCQPFSKSGFQRGMEETRGTLFWNIARILADERARPSVVLLENVRNLAGPRHQETFNTIVATLRQLGYRTASSPTVFSPHLLPRHLGGRPQVRERVFILGHYVGPEAAQDPANFDAPIVDFRALDLEWKKTQWDLAQDLPLQPDGEVDVRYGLESAELKWIEVWDALLTEVAGYLGPDERLPGFPIWLHHFADFRTLDEAHEYISRLEGAAGPLPAWKVSHLTRNAEWFERFGDIIEAYWPVISSFPASRQKFEWQAGEHRPLAQTIMHFRPSGIRCKRPDYVPALVAITQTTVLGDRRRLTPLETARLQGLPDTFTFCQTTAGGAIPQRDGASYKQMGNGVNVGAAYFLFRQYVARHAGEIPDHIVAAVVGAPSSPDAAGESVSSRQHDPVEAEEITSDRRPEGDFVPARDKLEAVNRLSARAGGGLEELGPGSTERKSVLMSVARRVGVADSRLNLSKPKLAELLVHHFGGRWGDECWSAGSTLTLHGLNVLLECVERELVDVPARSSTGFAAEAETIRDLVVRNTPSGPVDGRDAVTTMRLAQSADWAKTEWPGFYFEYLNLGPLMSVLDGRPAATNNTHCVLDLRAQHVWDLKVHRSGVRWTILNDMSATDWVLQTEGGIGLVVLTADMEFESEFNAWFQAQRIKHGKKARPRSRPRAYRRRLKSSFTARRLDVLYFSREDWTRAVSDGVIRGWAQPPQPGGQPRQAKYQIALDAASEWVVASHVW